MSTDKKLAGFFWIYCERIFAQCVTLVVTIVLARLVEPEKYGVVSLVTIFITIANVFVSSGYGTALIQKKDADELDFSSTLYASLFTAILIYTLIWICAAPISLFFDVENFTIVFRVMAIRIIFASVNTIQQAYISRNMEFKKLFVSTSFGSIVSAVLGIRMAYGGAGVWALVFQYLSNTTINTIVLAFTCGWRPKLVFSWKRVKTILAYGNRVLFSALIDVLYNNLRSLVIGKRYSATDLAFYSKADQFPQFIVTSINSSIDKLLLPLLSKEQDNKVIVKRYTRLAIRTSIFFMAPMLIGLAVCSREIISILLTDKWINAAPYMAVLCIMYMLYPIHTANLQAILAMGESKLYMRLEIIKKVLGVVFIVIALVAFDSVLAVTISGLCLSVIAVIINAWPNSQILGYTVIEQVCDLSTSILCAFVMGVISYFSGSFVDTVVLRLIVKIITGIFTYSIISFLFNKEDFNRMAELTKTIFNKVRTCVIKK